MALEHVIEIEGIRIGYDSHAGPCGEIQVLWNDEVTERFDATDCSVAPPCCVPCIEDGAWVELDGRCPHGRLSYHLKAGLI